MNAPGRLHGGVLRPLWLAFFVAAAAAAVYVNSLQGPFLFDDIPAIVENQNVRKLWPPSVFLKTPVGKEPVAGRPLVSFSFSLNYALGKLDVRGYHLFNLAVHLLAALTLFGILRRTLAGPKLGPRWGSDTDGLAWACATLWAVHPLLTESVTYVTQRTESMMGLFYLLTLYALIRSADTPKARLWQAAGVLCCAMGMGCKQSMLTAPLAVLLYDGIFLCPSVWEALRRRKIFYLGLASTWGLLAFFLFVAPPVRSVGWFISDLRPTNYILTQFGVTLHYLRLAFWPHPLALAYDWQLALSPGRIIPPSVFVAALLSVIAISLRRRTALGYLGAWFLLTLGPTALWPMATELVAERRMYLPLITVVVLVVAGGYRCLQRLFSAASPRARAALGTSLVLGLAAGLGTLTVRQNRLYQDEISIWSHTVAYQSRNPRAHNNLANALLKVDRIDEAIDHYLMALGGRKAGWMASPSLWPLLHYNLGLALSQRGHLKEAATHYRRALQLRPSLTNARNNLGLLLVDMGDLEGALIQLWLASEMEPQDAELHVNLGSVFDSMGRMDEAINQYQRALEINPALADAHNNLGAALMKQGLLTQALAHFEEALRLRSTDPEISANLEETREDLRQRAPATSSAPRP